MTYAQTSAEFCNNLPSGCFHHSGRIKPLSWAPTCGSSLRGENRLQVREEPRKRWSPVQLPVWRVHVQLVPDPCRHVDHVAGVLSRLSPRGCVGGIFASPNKGGACRRDAVASSSVMATRRSSTPSCFGELTGVYSRQMPRSLSSATSSGVVNYLPLSDRMHSTMDHDFIQICLLRTRFS